MAALLGMGFIGRQKLGQHQADRGEQPFRRIVNEGVLAVVGGIAAGIDNGLGQDLGVLFGLGPGSQILRIGPGNVPVPVDQGQEIVAVGAGWISQVNDRDVIPCLLYTSRCV